MTESRLSKFLIILNGSKALRVSTLVIFYFLVVLNMRPAIIGQKMGPLLIPLSLFVIFLILMWKTHLSIKKLFSPFMAFWFLISSYVILQMVLTGSDEPIGVLVSLILILVGFIAYLLGSAEVAIRFIRVLVLICAVLSVSYLVTIVLFVVGIYLPITTINLTTHTDWVYQLPIVFPFSPVYTDGALVNGIMYPRAIGLFREPGLYQMILIIAYWCIEIFRFKRANLLKVLMVISLVLTFSTAGYVLFLITIGWGYFIRSKHRLIFAVISLPMVVALLFFVVTTTSQFGLARKFDNESGRSRVEATLTALEIINDRPLMGIGFHNRAGNLEIGINFLGTIAQIGLLGVVFFLAPFLFVFLKVRKKHVGYVCILFALLLTMLFSQPLLDKSITYLILAVLLLASENTTITNDPVGVA